MDCDPRAVSVCRVCTRAGIVAGALLGGTTLVGWIVGSEALKDLRISDLGVKANTAICVFLTSMSLFCLFEFQNRGRAAMLGRVLAAVVFLVGILTLGEHIFGWNVGIDQMFFREAPGAVGTTSPNRMGPPAAIIFSMLGLSLLLFEVSTRKEFYPFQYLAIIGGLIAMMSLLGYAYSADSLYRATRYTAIAFPTAIALAALSLGILCSKPDRGLMKIVCADGPGGHMARSLLIPAIVVPFLLGWVRTMAEGRGTADDPTGRALLVLSMIVSFTGLIWWNARAIGLVATKQVRAERERDRSEGRLRAIYDGLHEYVGLLAPDGKLLEANLASLAFAGSRREDVIGLPFWETVWFQFTPGAPDAVRDAVARAAKGESVRFESRLVLPTGEIKTFDISFEPIRDETGKVVLIVPEGLDVTDRKQAEQSLVEMSRIIESSQDAIIGKTLDGIVTSWNAGAHRLYGYSAQEMVGHSIAELLPDGHKDELPPILKRLAECGHADHYETVRARKDGTLIDVSITVSPVRDVGGKIVGASAIARDITDRKRAEEAIRKNQAEMRLLNDTLEKQVAERTADAESRARQLRALALDLANTESRERKRLAQLLHDHFQQLVSAAKLKTGLVRRSTTDGKTVETLKQTENLLEQAIAASRTLATELSPPMLDDAGLVAALEWLARKMEAEYGIRITLHCEPTAEPESEQLRTLLFECARELLLNVAKHAQTNEASVSLKISAEGLLSLTIADLGKGFDARELNNDHRKKEITFGLFGIRERLGFIGGLLNVRSSAGEGTRMEMSVPVGIPRARELIGSERGNGGFAEKSRVAGVLDLPVRVLVADDHKLFRQGLIQLLSQDPDLKVIGEAADGIEAVELARQLRPDVLIVDVSMPGLTGIQVAGQVSRELPQTRIIGLSMHEDEDMAKAMLAAGATSYLTKGGSSEAVLDVLRSLTTKSARV